MEDNREVKAKCEARGPREDQKELSITGSVPSEKASKPKLTCDTGHNSRTTESQAREVCYAKVGALETWDRDI